MGEKLNRNDKIQINLAQITQNSDDTFRVIKASNERDFTCELCGQKHVSKVYTVLNVATGLTIRIGCECVKHFRLNQSDINKAESMLKRVEQSIRDSKKNLIQTKGQKLFDQLPDEEKRQIPRYKWSEKIEELGNNYFQDMPLAERSEFYFSAYMMYEAIRMYGGGASGYDELTYTYQKGIYIYSKEEIYAAVEKIGSRDVFEKEIAKIDEKKLANRRYELDKAISSFVYDSKCARKYVDSNILSNIQGEVAKLGLSENLSIQLEKLDKDIIDIKARDAKYPWLFAYTGTNSSIISIRNKLISSELSEAQVQRAQELIKEEESGITVSFMAEELVRMFPDKDFYQSLYRQRHNLSESQEYYVRKGYKERLGVTAK